MQYICNLLVQCKTQRVEESMSMYVSQIIFYCKKARPLRHIFSGYVCRSRVALILCGRKEKTSPTIDTV